MNNLVLLFFFIHTSLHSQPTGQTISVKNLDTLCFELAKEQRHLSISNELTSRKLELLSKDIDELKRNECSAKNESFNSRRTEIEKTPILWARNICKQIQATDYPSEKTKKIDTIMDKARNLEEAFNQHFTFILQTLQDASEETFDTAPSKCTLFYLLKQILDVKILDKENIINNELKSALEDSLLKKNPKAKLELLAIKILQMYHQKIFARKTEENQFYYEQIELIKVMIEDCYLKKEPVEEAKNILEAVLKLLKTFSSKDLNSQKIRIIFWLASIGYFSELLENNENLSTENDIDTLCSFIEHLAYSYVRLLKNDKIALQNIIKLLEDEGFITSRAASSNQQPISSRQSNTTLTRRRAPPPTFEMLTSAVSSLFSW